MEMEKPRSRLKILFIFVLFNTSCLCHQNGFGRKLCKCDIYVKFKTYKFKFVDDLII